MINLINAAMKWDIKEEDMPIAIQEEIQEDPVAFVEELIEGLASLIEVGTSPLSGKRYKGFSIEPGVFEYKIEIKVDSK